MAGLIRKSDIEEVKQRANSADIVGQYVTLKRGGADSLKGLCPFHDEKSPSFSVRPNVGMFKCFGCGESGDVYKFLQQIDLMTFTESVEKVAASINFTLTYEDGGAERETGNRSRLLEANRAAEQFFIEQLTSPEAATARDFLTSRGFDRAACDLFGVGYAPNSFDAVRKHLTAKKFTEAELEAAGLLSRGERGVYDRFRGRLVWPIRDVTGATIGFGARRLRDDDNGPKYLNTPETPVYHKAKVLYGLDLAKRNIAKDRRVVVVEGYTDVMACHLAGVTTAVATCGTAFGGDHVSLIRRVLGDVDAGDTRSRGEVIFTFDPDEAGQKAASKAFAEDSKFVANTFVVVAPDGLDPCDLRQQRGNAALAAIFETKTPLFEFMIRRTMLGFDLDTVEGRVHATRAVAPIISGIKDRSMVDGYVRVVSGWLGVEPADVRSAMQASNNWVTIEVESDPGTMDTFASLGINPTFERERDVMVALLRYPELMGLALAGDIMACQFTHPSLRKIHGAMIAAFSDFASPTWISRVIESSDAELHPLVSELAMVDIRVRPTVLPKPKTETPEAAMVRREEEARLTAIDIAAYVVDIGTTLIISDIVRQRTEFQSILQRTPEGAPERTELQRRIMELEVRRRSIRTE
ncbi:MAG: DNA primase [Microbacteriaceae bacterium]|nr:DNA primase [Microbacteriaceae bacterium]